MAQERRLRDYIFQLGIAGYFGVLIIAVGIMGWYWENFQETPKQPIQFPHYIHAGKLKLDCMYCHRYAGKSRYATVPAVKICIDCHKTAATDRPEVKKLLKYWAEKKPIPWIKVHGFRKNANVGFRHKPHIRAKIDCSVCHGRVDLMVTARKTRNINMGFCVNCHRSHHAPVDCWTCHQ